MEILGKVVKEMLPISNLFDRNLETADFFEILDDLLLIDESTISRFH